MPFSFQGSVIPFLLDAQATRKKPGGWSLRVKWDDGSESLGLLEREKLLDDVKDEMAQAHEQPGH